MNKLKSICYFFILLLFAGGKGALAFDIPARPNPPRLVNDFANVLAPNERQLLESKLVAYSDSTSNQIAIVIIPSLDGDILEETAYRIGDTWGVGGKDQDNGMVILVAINDRQVTIQTGRGMEGPLPDIITKKIIENIIVPEFKSNNYYVGLDRATDAVMKLAAGEFVDELENKPADEGLPAGLIFLIIIILLIILSRRNRGGGGILSRRGTFMGPILWGGGLGRGLGGGGFGGGGGGGGFGGFG
ncbi:MAG: TPM domain-containing protein, partial [Chitinophagales bacterium]|nr:TPM domain-containing protein [Chitinophagales bacterium]